MLISSKENAQIKLWRQCAADGRTRRKNQLFACEGARLCRDAALSGITIQTVLYTERAAQTYETHLQPVLQQAKTTLEITQNIAQYMADTLSPQGIFCICEMPQNRLSLSDLPAGGRFLALEDIQDPANLGTIIRTAEALGLDGVLLSAGCCDLYNPKVLRGSMGGVFRLPVVTADDFAPLLPLLRQKGIRSFACVPAEDALAVTEAPLTDGTVCLIGNEGNGLKAATVAACDARITIPMAGRAESLNAAMAAGIIMWELKRRI